VDRRMLFEVLKEERYMSVNVRYHPIMPFRDDLKKMGFITSRDLRKKKDGDLVWVAGRLILCHTPPTRSGIRVMFITVEDEYGLIDITVFPDKQALYAKLILSNPISIFFGRVRRMGKRDVSIVLLEARKIEDLYKDKYIPEAA